MLMGQGKTAVITPLLCVLLADGTQVPLCVLPDSLMEAGRTIIQDTFTTAIHKRVFTFQCNRSTAAQAQFLTMMQKALTRKWVIVSSPSSIKSVILKYVDVLRQLLEKIVLVDLRYNREVHEFVDSNLKEMHVWSGLLQSFKKTVLIMDELDWVCNPMKSELVSAIHDELTIEDCTCARASRLHIPLMH